MVHIIFATDSRGRGLDRYVQEHHVSWDTTFIIQPGANVQYLQQEIQRVIRPNDQMLLSLLQVFVTSQLRWTADTDWTLNMPTDRGKTF